MFCFQIYGIYLFFTIFGLFQQVVECKDGLFRNLNSLAYGTIQSSARSVEVSTSIEETGCHLVAGKLVDGAQADPYKVVALGVFAKRDTQAVPFDL